MKPLNTFNNVILGQFVLTGIPIKVYVDGVYYTITSPDDLEDPIYGFGMDEDGRMHEFDYRRIDHLLVNGNNITSDTFNDAMAKEFGGDDTAKEEGGWSKDLSDDKNWVMNLINDVRNSNITKLCKEDMLKCNALWKTYE